mgnify:CR=1 FL=1
MRNIKSTKMVDVSSWSLLKYDIAVDDTVRLIDEYFSAVINTVGVDIEIEGQVIKRQIPRKENNGGLKEL